MDLSDLFVSGDKTEVQAVESLGHRANQRQSQDQNPGHLTLRVKDHSFFFRFYWEMPGEISPQNWPVEAIGKLFGSMHHPRERSLAGTSPVCHHCSLLGVQRHSLKLLASNPPDLV